jgi:prefoldin subunit 5
MGLIVELSYDQALSFIPKKIELIKGKISRLEEEILNIELLKNQFMQ